jgi:hypothetical protein
MFSKDHYSKHARVLSTTEDMHRHGHKKENKSQKKSKKVKKSQKVKKKKKKILKS